MRQDVAVTHHGLRLHLGVSAYHTWSVLLPLRDQNGFTFVSLAGILRRCKSLGSTRNVRRALARLVRAGLVENIGSRRLSVAGREPLCFVRKVHGTWGDVCQVPAAAVEATAKLSTWGGRREGAGRKPKSSVALPDGGPQDSPERGTAGNQVCHQSSTPSVTSSGTATQYQKEALRALRIAELPPSDPSIGLELSTRSPATSAAPVWRAGMPEYPSAEVLPPAHVPPPPMLPPVTGDGSAALSMLEVAYQSVVSRRFGRYVQPHFATKRVEDPYSGEKVRVPDYESEKCLPFLNAAQVLRRNKVAPAAWAAFSVDVWREHVSDRRMPPASWVWSVRRMQERMDWFLSEENGYVGRRAVIGPRHRALIRRYAEMSDAVARERPAAGEELLAVVARYFPGDRYDRDVRAARAESEAKQRELDSRAREGEWLW